MLLNNPNSTLTSQRATKLKKTITNNCTCQVFLHYFSWILPTCSKNLEVQVVWKCYSCARIDPVEAGDLAFYKSIKKFFRERDNSYMWRLKKSPDHFIIALLPTLWILFWWGTGYTEVGWGITKILSTIRSEQHRFGKGHYNETWSEAFGFNLLEGDLKPITPHLFFLRAKSLAPLNTLLIYNSLLISLYDIGKPRL